MKKRTILFAMVAGLGLAACETPADKPLFVDEFYLGAATEANINVQSIRDPRLPNNKGIVGEASGERAVVAIDKLNRAKANGETDATSVNTSGG